MEREMYQITSKILFWITRFRTHWSRFVGNLGNSRCHESCAVGSISLLVSIKQMDKLFNTLRLEQNDRYLVKTCSNTFSWLKIRDFWLKFNWHMGPIDNKSTLVQVMVWHRGCISWKDDDHIRWCMYVLPSHHGLKGLQIQDRVLL